jgi:hypothetical protein
VTSRLAAGRARAIAGLLCVLLLAACGGGDPTAADAQRVFADGFLSDADAVEIEAAGGTVVPTYAGWIVFRARDVPELRHGVDYREIPCDEPRAFFARALGPGPLLPPERGLRCLAFSEPRFQFDNGRWLIEDRAAGRYYFRVWKGYRDGR